MREATPADRRNFAAALLFSVLTLPALPTPLLADEGGVSFWLPGLFGSLAAVPGEPGPSFAAIYYHSSVDAGTGKNFVLGGGVVGGLSARTDLGFFGPTYTFAMPVLGPDIGSGATLGSFESRVGGIGPQIGFIFPIGGSAQGYINVKGYKEFAAQNRPAGWNAWLTLSMTPAAPRPAAEQSLLFPTSRF